MSIITRNTENDYEEIIGIYEDSFHEIFINKLNDLFMATVSASNNISSTQAIEKIVEYNSIITNINNEFKAVIKKNLKLDDKVRSYKTMIEELYDQYEEEDDQ